MWELDFAANDSALYDTIHQHRLTHWTTIYATLNLNFRGLELLLEYTDTPLKQLWIFTEEAVKVKPEWRDQHLVERIAHCQLWMIHVTNVTGSWHPLRETYANFSQRGRTTMWEDDRPYPDPDVVSEWLRKRLKDAKSPT